MRREPIPVFTGRDAVVWKGGTLLDGGEVAWLRYLIDHFLRPCQYAIEGRVIRHDPADNVVHEIAVALNSIGRIIYRHSS